MPVFDACLNLMKGGFKGRGLDYSPWWWYPSAVGIIVGTLHERGGMTTMKRCEITYPSLACTTSK